LASNEELVSLSLSTVAKGRFDKHVDDRVLDGWYHEAAGVQATLVVLRSASTLELFSTQRDYSAASVGVLRAVALWSKHCPALCQFQVSFRRGQTVARHLFAHVAGIGERKLGSILDSEQIEKSMRLAKSAGSLSYTMASLLRAAQNVERRVASEALEGAVAPSENLREMAGICSERIVEEELLLWKSEQAELYRALASMGSGYARGPGSIPAEDAHRKRAVIDSETECGVGPDYSHDATI
jgi:hypothetical protein